MKWREFKKIIESQDVCDETEISYIDTDMFRPTVYFTIYRKAFIE